MQVAAQIRQNSKEYSEFVTELHKWTREASAAGAQDDSVDLCLENVTLSNGNFALKNGKEYYRKWEEFDVEKELENVDYAVQCSSQNSQDKFRRLKEALMRKELGNEYFKKGFYQKALSEYTQSLTLDFNEKTLGNRALVWLKLGMFLECVQDCSKLIEVNSKSIKGYWRRGVAKSSLGDVEEARKDLEYALVLEPGNKSIREDLQKIMENKQVKPEKIRPERVRVEIQEIGLSRHEHELLNNEKKPEKEFVIPPEEEPLKNGLVKQAKTLETNVQELEITEVEIKEPSCLMDFERDFKRFKKDKNVFYQYIKVGLLKIRP